MIQPIRASEPPRSAMSRGRRLKALILQKKRKLAATACQKSRRDMPGDRRVTGRSRRGSSGPRGQQVWNELFEAAGQPRWTGVLALIQIERGSTVLDDPANGVVRPHPGDEENRHRSGPIEPLFQSPERQGGDGAIHGGHHNIQDDERNWALGLETPDALGEER